MVQQILPEGCQQSGVGFETGELVFGPPPRPHFFSVRPVEDRIGEVIDSRDSSESSRSIHPGSTSMEKT